MEANYLKKKLIVLFLMLFVLLSCSDSVDEKTSEKYITNPVAQNGGDPWIIKHIDDYYYCYSLDTRIAVSKSNRIEEALVKSGQIVFRAPQDKEY